MGKCILALIKSRGNSRINRRSWARLLFSLACGAIIGVELFLLLDHITFFNSGAQTQAEQIYCRQVIDSSERITDHTAVNPRTRRTWFKVFLGILVRSARAEGRP